MPVTFNDHKTNRKWASQPTSLEGPRTSVLAPAKERMSDSTNKSNAIVVETKIIPSCTAVRSIWRKRIGSISIFSSCSLALAQLSRKQAPGTSGFRNNPCLQGLLALDQADIQVMAEVRPEFQHSAPFFYTGNQEHLCSYATHTSSHVVLLRQN